LLLPACAVLLASLGACQSSAIRLYELREAEAGSPERAAYERVEGAIELANEFLETSEFARGFPAGAARFSLSHSDILITLESEGIFPLRIETTGWADPRTAFGDGIHPTEHGFLSARRTDPAGTGKETTDSAFLLLEPPEMAGMLLRQAATVRELRLRGALDYWINYNLLGLDPSIGWHEDSTVNERAEAVHDAFEVWHAERFPVAPAG
jgi:hypothetical protein